MEDDDNAAMSEWTEVWRTDNSRRERDAYLSDGLPRFATVRSEIRNCTIDHLINEDVDLALSRYSMRTILTACRSSRCEVEHVDEACMCRYKINTCLGGNTTVVYQQGWHLMLDVGAESPPYPHLTRSMRELLSASLTANPGASAFQLFALICHCIEVDDLAGPPPTREQVASYLRTWRRRHPVDGVQHVLELLDTALFDAVDMSPDTPRSAVYFSDSVFSICTRRIAKPHNNRH